MNILNRTYDKPNLDVHFSDDVFTYFAYGFLL